jgi:phosphoglycolate phosphatase
MQQTVIFDLDGTLVDSLAGITRAMNQVLAAEGFPPHTPDAYRRMVGDGVSWLVTRALPQDQRHPGQIERYVSAYKQAYETLWRETTLPFPGIPDLLRELTARRIPCAVLSNKSHGVTTRMVSTLFPTFPFADVLGQRPGHPLKPDPAPAIALSLAMGGSPVETWFVGDSAVDMETARRAGMKAAGVSWGMRTPKELKESGAMTVLTSPGELLNLL